MIKTITTLLLFTLLFTACTERGTTLTPKHMKQKPIHIENVASSIKKKISFIVKDSKNTKTTVDNKPDATMSSCKDANISNLPMQEQASTEEKGVFSLNLSDKTKNNISGFFILTIGVMIII